jgi:hypothetical protein
MDSDRRPSYRFHRLGEAATHPIARRAGHLAVLLLLAGDYPAAASRLASRPARAIHRTRTLASSLGEPFAKKNKKRGKTKTIKTKKYHALVPGSPVRPGRSGNAKLHPVHFAGNLAYQRRRWSDRQRLGLRRTVVGRQSFADEGVGKGFPTYSSFFLPRPSLVSKALGKPRAVVRVSKTDKYIRYRNKATLSK